MFASVQGNVAWTLAGLYAVLVVATIATAVIVWRKPRWDYSDLVPRMQSWWAIVTLFAIAILLDRIASLVFLGFVSFLALKEYLSLIPTRRADRKVLLWAYLAIPIQYAWAGAEAYGFFIIFIPVYMFLLLPTMMVIYGETPGFLRAAGSLHWGLMTCVFTVSHAGFLLMLPAAVGAAVGGAGLLLFLLILTQVNDVGQYVFGKLIGRIRAAPSVSPRKTVEGFFGGLATTTGLALLLAPFLTPFWWAHAAATGLIIGFAGFLGDLTLSALKRDLGIKDTGRTLPGHGGVLDRIDSLTFSAPLFFHFVYYFYY